MEFKSGKSYFCKKSYGLDYYNKVNQLNQMNQFLMYTQPKTRYGVNTYDYDMDMYYIYGGGYDTVYKTPVPKFTAGSIYRCRLGGSLIDDRGLLISMSQIDPNDFAEVELKLSDGTKCLMTHLGTFGISLEVMPQEVVGGELKDGMIDNPDLSVTEFKIHVSRVGSFLRGGRLSNPPILETDLVEAGDNLSEAMDKAIYKMWKKIRIKSAWCDAIHRTLNIRAARENRATKPRIFTYTKPTTLF